MSTLDDFFGPTYDAVEEEAKCLICDKSSKVGGGEWVTTSLWVCVDHIAEYHQQKTGEQTEIDAVVDRVKAGQGTLEDLNIVVSAGLATYTYEAGESNRINGVEWLTPPGSPYADQVDN